MGAVSARAGPSRYGRHVIRAHLAAELLIEGESWPVFVWTIDHPAGLVLVDTGMIDSRPEIDDMSPAPHPENIPRDVACVINTHLHFDHCGGNRLFPGLPIHVQARELADARSLDDYTIREWVDFDGATYVEHEGEVEVLPGIRLLPAPGHTDGHVSFYRERDRILIAGDAVSTTKAESLLAIATQRPELHGPPAYYTSDWDAAKRSVEKLAELRPFTVAPGHGKPMAGPEVADALMDLAVRFDEVARPKRGRYARGA